MSTRVLLRKLAFLCKLLSDNNDVQVISRDIFSSLASVDVYNISIIQQCKILFKITLFEKSHHLFLPGVSGLIITVLNTGIPSHLCCIEVLISTLKYRRCPYHQQNGCDNSTSISNTLAAHYILTNVVLYMVNIRIQHHAFQEVKPLLFAWREWVECNCTSNNSQR